MFRSRFYLPRRAEEAARSHTERLEPFFYAGDDYDVYDHAIIEPLRPCADWSGPEARVWEGGVCDDGFNLLSRYVLRRTPHLPLGDEVIRAYPTAVARHIDDTVIYGGELSATFGSVITHSFTRLWYAIQHRELRYRVALVRHSGFEVEDSFHLRLLELCGIARERVLLIDQATQFKAVIVPRQSVYWHDSWCPTLFPIPFEAARRSLTPRSERRLYLSCTRGSRHLTGEEFFEEFFSRHGYKVLHLEQLPLSEQCAYLAGAEEVACTHGTLSHQLMFARPGTRFICLLRDNYSTIGLRQPLVNAALELDFVFVSVALDLLPLPHRIECHLLGPTVYWNAFVRDEFGEEPAHRDALEYLNATGLRLGDYLRQYLQCMSDGRELSQLHHYRFDCAGYLRGLFEHFDPERTPELEQALVGGSSTFFAGRVFNISCSGHSGLAVVRLCEDGTIEGHTPSAFELGAGAVFWGWHGGQLFFMDASCRPAYAFDIDQQMLLERCGAVRGVGVCLDDLSVRCTIAEA